LSPVGTGYDLKRGCRNMNIYSFLSPGYDILDITWFSDKGDNPRDVIRRIIPNRKCRVLDLCCGTFSNGIQIAKNNPRNFIVGIDRSPEMLRKAKSKVRKDNLKNCRFRCCDASETGIKDSSFDYIILGLVLHECNDRQWKDILSEAGRLLKENGRLIVLEWDAQRKTGRKIKFAPLYAAEAMLNPGFFREFYHSDKRKFFRKYGFEITDSYECNYSSVLVMEKH